MDQREGEIWLGGILVAVACLAAIYYSVASILNG